MFKTAGKELLITNENYQQFMTHIRGNLYYISRDTLNIVSGINGLPEIVSMKINSSYKVELTVILERVNFMRFMEGIGGRSFNYGPYPHTI
jgi:hypothetical protein